MTQDIREIESKLNMRKWFGSRWIGKLLGANKKWLSLYHKRYEIDLMRLMVLKCIAENEEEEVFNSIINDPLLADIFNNGDKED
jgi:hypothetical protein